jgi:hypothetical protein
MHSERRFDDPALRQASKAIELVLVGHAPYPALAVDRHWTLVSANAAVGMLQRSGGCLVTLGAFSVARRAHRWYKR